MATKQRTLFLKFVLLNAVALVALVAGAITYGSKIHGPSLVAIPIILGVTIFAQVGAGRICWTYESSFKSDWLSARLMHEAKFLGHFAWVAQITGILSTVLGFWLLLTAGGTDTATLHDRIQSGGGVALVGTFVGICASLLLVQTERLIDHDLGG